MTSTRTVARGGASDNSGVLDDPEDLLEAIRDASCKREPDKRLLVGITGAPASGKSTLAQWLVERINTESADVSPAIVVPMDGFHLDDSILHERGLLPVKGSPDTFDAAGFLVLLKRLSDPLPVNLESSSAVSSLTVYIPVFDRTMELSRCAGAAVTTQHRIIIVEGNYLMLNRPIWRDVPSQLDLSVSLDVPLDLLEQRLIERWEGLGFTEEVARRRALSNDIPNARVVVAESLRSGLVLKHSER